MKLGKIRETVPKEGSFKPHPKKAAGMCGRKRT
jgi:hypothetical protein